MATATTDFSWLSGGLVAGGLYWLLAQRTGRTGNPRPGRNVDQV